MKTFVIASCLIAVACAQAAITEPLACTEQSFSWQIPAIPTAPAGSETVLVPPVWATVPPVNFSDILKKVTDVADNVQTNVNVLYVDNVNGELNWVQDLEVDMQGMDSTMPLEQLAVYTSAAGSSTSGQLSPKITATQDDIIRYFKGGQVTLTVVLGPDSGTYISLSDAQTITSMNGQVGTNLHVCMSVSGSVSKSL